MVGDRAKIEEKIRALKLADMRTIDADAQPVPWACMIALQPRVTVGQRRLLSDYGYPIEELTFGGILARNPLARIMIPKRLEATRRQLLALAARNPDLAAVYTARAAVFAERISTFEPDAVVKLSERRRTEAIGFMDRLEQALGDGRAVLVPPAYGVADVVWTVFLGRMEFAGLGAEIPGRPALARYWAAMQARPSFSAADIWTKFHIGRLIGGILGIGRG